MITGIITGQDLRLGVPIIAADTLNYLTAQFVFKTEPWSGLIKIAHFSNGEESADIELTDDAIRAEDGLNLTEGKWQLSLTGHEIIGGEIVKRITTTVAEFTVKRSGVPDGEPLPSLPSYGEQILAEVTETNEKLESFVAQAETLAPGSEATAEYDYPLFSFGIPAGAQGEKGDKGDKGDTGSQGIQGEKGDKGDKGDPGEKGETGAQGEQGIQGAKGDKGDKGDTGAKGEKGDKGDPGEVTEAELATALAGKANIDSIAHAYNSSLTYKRKEYVLYDGDLYICVTDINTPEAWNIDHWASATLGVGITSIFSAINLIYKILRASDITPAELQVIAKSGRANEIFSPGDIIYIPWTDNSGNTPVEYSVPVVIADFRTVEDENGVTYQNAIMLMWMYATTLTIPFDASEIVSCTEGTAIESGFYYYEKSGDNYVKLNPQPEVGSTVPTGSTYYKHDLDNAGGAIRYGLNDWKWSAYRQQLNSAAAKGEGWWTSQHPCDVEPSATVRSYPGFLDGFTPEWRAIFKPIKVGTKRNTVTFSGETVYTYDTFFLPSRSEMCGNQTNAAEEGTYWQYWKDATGLSSPIDGSSTNTNNARKIPAITNPSGSAVNVRLRSAYTSGANSTWSVYSTGYINTNYANAAYSALPACAIY